MEDQQLDIDTSHLSIYLSAPSLEDALSLEQAPSAEASAEEPSSPEQSPSPEPAAEEPSAAASASDRWTSPETAGITLESSVQQQVSGKRQRQPSQYTFDYDHNNVDSGSRKKPARRRSSSAAAAAQAGADGSDSGRDGTSDSGAAPRHHGHGGNPQGSRFRFNPDQNTIMRQWLMSHIDEPYPE
jgi:hypothetical protein